MRYLIEIECHSNVGLTTALRRFRAAAPPALQVDDIVPFKENVKDLRWDGRTDPGDTFLWDDPEPDDFEEDDADWDAVIQLNDDF